MTPSETSRELTFAQGLQLFFIQRILEEHTMSTFFGDDNLNKMLMQWSGIVQAGLKEDPDFPCSLYVPDDGFWRREHDPGMLRSTPLRANEIQEGSKAEEHVYGLALVPDKYRETYRPLLANPDFSAFKPLLGNEDLGRLMQVEFTAELAELAKATAPAAKAEGKDAEIVREAVARQLGKKLSELTEEDYRTISELSLAGSGVTDISEISRLANLQTLLLNDTQVSDIGALSGLTNLQSLYLFNTAVSDIGALSGLTNLQELYLKGTKVTEIDALSGLTELRTLHLEATEVDDEKVGRLKEALPKCNILRL